MPPSSRRCEIRRVCAWPIGARTRTITGWSLRSSAPRSRCAPPPWPPPPPRFPPLTSRPIRASTPAWARWTYCRFVPLRDITLAECAALAVSVGQELAARHGLPVYLYEAASPHHRALPTVRKDAFHRLPPDFGPAVPHPTAGAVVVGARGPLIAYNVNLATPDIAIARALAREVRSGASAHCDGVRALGLALHSRGLTQVSMNITRPAETSLLSVFSYVSRRAQDLGTTVVESEVIGALPGPSAFGVLAEALQATLKPGQVLLENWPEEPLPAFGPTGLPLRAGEGPGKSAGSLSPSPSLRGSWRGFLRLLQPCQQRRVGGREKSSVKVGRRDPGDLAVAEGRASACRHDTGTGAASQSAPGTRKGSGATLPVRSRSARSLPVPHEPHTRPGFLPTDICRRGTPRSRPDACRACAGRSRSGPPWGGE